MAEGDRDTVRGILYRGGTILGTSRMDPYVHGDGYASCARTIKRTGLDRLLVVCGEATLRFVLASSHLDIRREVLTEVMAQYGEPWAAGLLLELFNDPSADVRGEERGAAAGRGCAADSEALSCASSASAAVRVSAAVREVRVVLPVAVQPGLATVPLNCRLRTCWSRPGPDSRHFL